jgi:cobalamin biosynthesis protein CobW
VLVNKTDLLDAATLDRLRGEISATVGRAVKMVPTQEGRVDLAVLLGLAAAAEDDLAARPSHHDAEDGAHEHDDFESFVVPLGEVEAPETLVSRLVATSEAHDIFRMKGFAAVRGKPMRLAVQGVGARFRHQFDQQWAPGATRTGHMVVIGRSGLDRAAITAAIQS